MPSPLLAASAITSAVGGAAKIGLGVGQLIHGNKLEDQNVRPDYVIQNEYNQNRNLGLSMAQQGLTDTSKDYYTDQAARGLSAGIDATLQGGGGPNAIAGLTDQYQQNLEGLAAKDSQLQTDNIRYAIERNNDLAAQKTMKWTLDKFNKYQEIANAAAKEKEAGIQNIFGGLDQSAASGAAYSQANAYEQLLKSSAGTPTTNPGPTYTPSLERYTDYGSAPPPSYGGLGNIPSNIPILAPKRQDVSYIPSPSKANVTPANYYNSGRPLTMAELHQWAIDHPNGY